MVVATSSRIELESIGQSFALGDTRVNLFRDLSLSIEQGQSYAITGPSGAGKSSLLVLMSGLDTPSEGRCRYVENGRPRPLSALREDIGFVFQQFHLLSELTALHNVALPLKLRGRKDAESQAKALLERVGLGHRLHHKPQQLSGGEQQRTAIARALVFEPRFIFADEPTGNLDIESAHGVADMLFECCNEKGAGLVVVTHSDELAARAQHVFSLKDGTGTLSSSAVSRPLMAEVASC